MLSALEDVLIAGTHRSRYEIAFANRMIGLLNVLCSLATDDDVQSDDPLTVKPYPYLNPIYIDQSTLNDIQESLVVKSLSWVHTLTDAFYEAARNHMDTKRGTMFVEKVPGHLHSRNILREVFPGLKEILLVRHPYDVVVSSRRFFCWAEQDRELMHLNQIFTCLLKTLEMHNDQVFLLKYEHLISNPQQILADLLNYLGVVCRMQENLDLMLAWGDRLAAELPQHITSSSAAASIGRWKTELTDQKLLRKCEYWFGDVCMRLGYDV